LQNMYSIIDNISLSYNSVEHYYDSPFFQRETIQNVDIKSHSVEVQKTVKEVDYIYCHIYIYIYIYILLPN